MVSRPSGWAATTVPSGRTTYRDWPKTQAGTLTSASTGSTGVRLSRPSTRWTFHQSLRSELTYRVAWRPHSGCTSDSPPKPASRRAPRRFSTPPASSSRPTHSCVESQGMFGWSQASHANCRPSREMRGAATKSDPEKITRGSAEPSTGSTTSSLWTSRPGSGPSCRSRTQTIHRPSGVTRPSAYRQERGAGGSGEIGNRLAPGVDPVQPLVLPRGREHGAAVDPPGAAAVLVHRCARVEPGRQHLVDAAIRVPSHDRLPPGLEGTGLTPPDDTVGCVQGGRGRITGHDVGGGDD